jgi:serine/threonine protein kinase
MNTEDLTFLETWGPVNDKYKIVKFLGSGTYGKVMRGVNRSTGQVVAIK